MVSDPEGFSRTGGMNYSDIEHLLRTLQARAPTQTTDCSILWEKIALLLKRRLLKCKQHKQQVVVESHHLHSKVTTKSVCILPYQSAVMEKLGGDWMKYCCNENTWWNYVTNRAQRHWYNAACQNDKLWQLFFLFLLRDTVFSFFCGYLPPLWLTLLSYDNIVLHSYAPNTQFLN